MTAKGFSCIPADAGAVTVNAGTIQLDSEVFGLACDKALTMNGGMLDAGTAVSFPIPAGDVFITGGTVTAGYDRDGTPDFGEGFGINADGGVTISGGTVKVGGELDGIYCKMIKVEGGIVTAESNNGEDTNILSYDDAFTWSDWAVPALCWACGTDVLSSGSTARIRPADDATRGEIARAIHVFREEAAK